MCYHDEYLGNSSVGNEFISSNSKTHSFLLWAPIKLYAEQLCNCRDSNSVHAFMEKHLPFTVLVMLLLSLWEREVRLVLHFWPVGYISLGLVSLFSQCILANESSSMALDKKLRLSGSFAYIWNNGVKLAHL